MQHLDFIIWMLLYPIMWEFVDYMKAKSRPDYKFEKIDWFTGLFFLSTWLGIGKLLF